MNRTEQSAPAALPLAVAAARLGISRDALRMRLRRGKAKGFKRGGRLFIELSEQPNGPAQAAAGQGEHAPSEPAAPGEPAGTAPNSGPDDVPDQALPVIIEFQKVELSRLLRDNTRLNRRLDQLTEEMRLVREMQQREQVLRQQDLALRHQIQGMLDRLTERLSPAAAEPGRLGAGQMSAPPAPAVGDEDAPTTPTTALGPAYAYGPREGAVESAADPNAGDPDAEAPNAEAAEFAAMLKEIGAALRDLDSPPPETPTETPPDGGNAASSEGPIESAPAQPVGDAGSPIPAAPPEAPDDETPDDETPDDETPDDETPDDETPDDEARLLEILGRMGPLAEDRRTAARIMERLLGRRGASGLRDPES